MLHCEIVTIALTSQGIPRQHVKIPLTLEFFPSKKWTLTGLVAEIPKIKNVNNSVISLYILETCLFNQFKCSN